MSSLKEWMNKYICMLCHYEIKVRTTGGERKCPACGGNMYYAGVTQD